MNEPEENEKVTQPESEPTSWDLQAEGAPFFYGVGLITEAPTVSILGFESGGEFFQCD